MSTVHQQNHPPCIHVPTSLFLLFRQSRRVSTKFSTVVSQSLTNFSFQMNLTTLHSRSNLALLFRQSPQRLFLTSLVVLRFCEIQLHFLSDSGRVLIIVFPSSPWPCQRLFWFRPSQVSQTPAKSVGQKLLFPSESPGPFKSGLASFLCEYIYDTSVDHVRPFQTLVLSPARKERCECFSFCF